ncbi:MAG TPA: hypothetical protein VIM61_14585 [Chthoniobacterales bacterium]|jgi:hypothetical protein
MRSSSVLLALAISLISPTLLQAIPVSQGKIVQGRYEVNGRSSSAGVSVRYRSSNVHVSNHGNLKGWVSRQVTANGRLIEYTLVRIHGSVGPVKVRARKGTFEANAVIKLGKGAKFRGKFVGLSDRSQKKSRYFHGKLNGNKHSNLTLRSR